MSKKYEELHATKWLPLFEMHRLCNSFVQGERLVTAEGMKTTFASIVAPFPCSVRNLAINQGSALEKFCEGKAKEMLDEESSSLPPSTAAIVSNDGTNACTFLSLKICEKVACMEDWSSNNEGYNEISANLAILAEEVIEGYPNSLNKIRNVDCIYNPLEAYQIMKQNDHIRSTELTEELPYNDMTFSTQGREQLQRKIEELYDTMPLFVSLYVCEPYCFSIGSINGMLFFVDTHAVPLACGGKLNAQVRVYPKEEGSPRVVCRWIWERLVASGVKNSPGQSLPLLKFAPKKEITTSLTVSTSAGVKRMATIDLTFAEDERCQEENMVSLM